MTSQLTIESLKRKNFGANEFIHSDTANRPGIDNNVYSDNTLVCLMKVADKIQEIRDKIGVPVSITSGYRCVDLNKAVGGSAGSKHIQGLGIDCNAKGFTQDTFVRWIKASGISVDKCFVERGCVHMQFCLNDDHNKNYFGTAEKIGKHWIVKELK